jgi:hypothetical protein
VTAVVAARGVTVGSVVAIRTIVQRGGKGPDRHDEVETVLTVRVLQEPVAYTDGSRWFLARSDDGVRALVDVADVVPRQLEMWRT